MFSIISRTNKTPLTLTFIARRKEYICFAKMKTFQIKSLQMKANVINVLHNVPRNCCKADTRFIEFNILLNKNYFQKCQRRELSYQPSCLHYR